MFQLAGYVLKKVLSLLTLATLTVSMSIVALASNTTSGGIPITSRGDSTRFFHEDGHMRQDVELIDIESHVAWNVAPINTTLFPKEVIVTPRVSLSIGDSVVFHLTVSIANQVVVGVAGATTQEVSARPWASQFTQTIKVADSGMQNAFIDNVSNASVRVNGTITFNTAHAFDAPLQIEIDSYIYAYESLDLWELIQKKCSYKCGINQVIKGILKWLIL